MLVVVLFAVVVVVVLLVGRIGTGVVVSVTIAAKKQSIFIKMGTCISTCTKGN